MNIRDLGFLGYLPVRHTEPGVPIGRKNVLYAVTIDGRDALGAYHCAEGARGDVLPPTLWKQYLTGKAQRALPGYSWAWPSVVTTADTSGDGAPSGTVIRGETIGGQRVRPAYGVGLAPDDRFKEKTPETPDWATRFPRGWTGMVGSASKEEEQVETWHPDALGLVAVDRAGSPRLSTAVLDLDKEDRVDPERRALLHTFMGVVKQPTGLAGFGGGNAIAWRLGRGPDGQAGHGLVIDGSTGSAKARTATQNPVDPPLERTTGGPLIDPRASPVERGQTIGRQPDPGIQIGSVIGDPGTTPGDPIPPSYPRNARGVLACASVRGGGPLDVGDEEDAHFIGLDADGRPINALHLSTLSLVRGAGGDGPLAFEAGPFPKLKSLPHLAPAHIRFDPATPHTGIYGTKPGMWRVYAETFIYIEDPKRRVPPRNPPTNPDPVPTPDPGGGTFLPDPGAPEPYPPHDPGRGGVPAGGGQTGTGVGAGGGRQPTPPKTNPDPFDPPGTDEEGQDKRRRPGGKPSGSVDVPDSPGTDEQPWGPPPFGGGRRQIPEGENPSPIPPRGTPGGSIDDGPFVPLQPGGDPTPYGDPPDKPYPRRQPPGGYQGPGGSGLFPEPGGGLPDDPPDPSTRFIGATRREDVDRAIGVATGELALPGILIRPQPFWCGVPDLRNDPRPDLTVVRQMGRAIPVIARIEGAFGKVGADCNRGEPNYTARPGAARYPGGTAPGVVGYFPGETGMEDAASSFAPAGINLSTVHFVGLRGKVFFGSGLPDPTGGGLKSGWRWAANASGILKFEQINSGGSVATTQTMPAVSGTLAVAAGSGVGLNSLAKGDGSGGLANSSVTDDGATVTIGVGEILDLRSSYLYLPSAMQGGGAAELAVVSGALRFDDGTGAEYDLDRVLKRYVKKTATSGGNYNVAAADDSVFVDASALTAGQNYDVTLPSAVTLAGREVAVKVAVAAAAAATVTVKSAAGKVENAAAGTGQVWSVNAVRPSAVFRSNGTDWWYVGTFGLS